MSKKLIALIVIILVAGAGYYWFTSNGNAAEQEQAGGPPGGFAMPVVTAKVAAEVFVDEVEAVGTLEATDFAHIRAEVSGAIKSIVFSEGQPVKAGEVLLEIDPSTYQAELNRAKASFDLAKRTYDRQQKLKESGYASGQDRDVAESSYRETRAAHEVAALRFEKSKVKAPFNGLAGLRNVSVGDYVDVGATLTEVVAIEQVKVQFSMPEKYFSRLTQDMPVKVKVDAYASEVFEGKVFAVDAKVDPVTRNIAIKAVIDNAAGKLRPGMFAYVKVEFGREDNVLFVPEEALIPQGQQMMVMKVVDGKVEPAMVRIGNRVKGKAVVLEGLVSGDEIITAGHAKVGPGMPVMAVNNAQPEAHPQPEEQPADQAEGEEEQ